MGKPLHIEVLHVDHTPYPANGECKMGSCPTLYRTGRGSFLVQGHWLPQAEKAGLALDTVEDVVEVPEKSMIDFARKILGMN